MPSPALGLVCKNSKVNGGILLSIQKIHDASHLVQSKQTFLEKFPTQCSEKREYRNLKHSNLQKKTSNNQIINKLSQNKEVLTTYSCSAKTSKCLYDKRQKHFPCAMNEINGYRTNFSNQCF